MAVVTKASVTTSTPTAGAVTMTFTDETTGLGTVTARTLVISDSNGNVVDNINMGTSLTATFQINSDGYYSFLETIVDNTGTYPVTVNAISTSFYDFLFPTLIADISSTCTNMFDQIYNLSRAELYRRSAVTNAAYSRAVAAQTDITLANQYLNTPYYA